VTLPNEKSSSTAAARIRGARPLARDRIGIRLHAITGAWERQRERGRAESARGGGIAAPLPR
jgi:hypothetical protein